jgi:hypothetical protein
VKSRAYHSLLLPPCKQDEPFHVNQTQRYCAGRFNEWDSKITTLPGLYLAALGWVRAVALLHAASGSAAAPQGPGREPSTAPLTSLAHAAQGHTLLKFCSTPWLRAMNVVLAAACVPVLASAIRASWHACAAASQPLAAAAAAPTKWPVPAQGVGMCMGRSPSQAIC